EQPERSRRTYGSRGVARNACSFENNPLLLQALRTREPVTPSGPTAWALPRYRIEIFEKPTAASAPEKDRRVGDDKGLKLPASRRWSESFCHISTEEILTVKCLTVDHIGADEIADTVNPETSHRTAKLNLFF